MAFFSSGVTPHTALFSMNRLGMCAAFTFERGSASSFFVSDCVWFVTFGVFLPFVNERIF